MPIYDVTQELRGYLRALQYVCQGTAIFWIDHLDDVEDLDQSIGNYFLPESYDEIQRDYRGSKEARYESIVSLLDEFLFSEIACRYDQDLADALMQGLLTTIQRYRFFSRTRSHQPIGS